MRNRLTVLEEAGRNKQSHLLLKCRCDCGNITITNKYRKPKSCGHCNLNKKFPKEYNTYNNIMYRCYTKSCKDYKYYGGRGIIVCERWRIDFFNFLQDMGICPEDKNSIDRKNNNGNYEKENCRWANSFEQNRNQSSNHAISF